MTITFNQYPSWKSWQKFKISSKNDSIAYSPYYSLYIYYGADKENLFDKYKQL